MRLIIPLLLTSLSLPVHTQTTTPTAPAAALAPSRASEGIIPFQDVIASIASLNGFAGFANLETTAPSQSIPADMRRNLGFIRNLTSKYASA